MDLSNQFPAAWATRFIDYTASTASSSSAATTQVDGQTGTASASGTSAGGSTQSFFQEAGVTNVTNLTGADSTRNATEIVGETTSGMTSGFLVTQFTSFSGSTQAVEITTSQTGTATDETRTTTTMVSSSISGQTSNTINNQTLAATITTGGTTVATTFTVHATLAVPYTTTTFSTAPATSTITDGTSSITETYVSSLTYAANVSTTVTLVNVVPTVVTTSAQTTVTTKVGTSGTTTVMTTSVNTTANISIPYTQVSNTTVSSAQTLTGMAISTAESPDGIPFELCNPTYYVPSGFVAWVVTGSDTTDSLRMLSDVAQSFTDSFTFGDFTTTYADAGGGGGPVTYFPVGVTVVDLVGVTITFSSSFSTSTTTTVSTLDQVSASTRTVSTTVGTTDTFSELLSIETTTILSASSLSASLVAAATDVSTYLLALHTTTTGYVELYDDLGRVTDLTSIQAQTQIWTTAVGPRAKGAESSSGATTVPNSSDTTATSSGTTENENASGGTFISTLIPWGLVTPDTAPMSVLDPARPAGVCLPTGQITDRTPAVDVGAGALVFPAMYAWGQQPNVYCPFPLRSYILISAQTTSVTSSSPSTVASTTNGTTYSISFSSVSVTAKYQWTVSSTFSGGTISALTSSSSSGVLTTDTPISDTWWAQVLGAGASVYGGATPDGRAQKVLIYRAICDQTSITDETVDGSINIADESYFPADTNAPGLAIANLPCYDIAWGPPPFGDISQAILLPEFPAGANIPGIAIAA